MGGMADLSESFALNQDAMDPLREVRADFFIPPSPSHKDGREAVYLCGNSLGCMPKGVDRAMREQLEDWAQYGVEGHFAGRDPWYPYHEQFRGPLARLVGAREHEVVAMNSLSVNLHLLMASFYQPTRDRRKILIDWPCFPSDVYAVKSQIRMHGHDPEEALIWAKPRPGEHTIRTEDVLDILRRDGTSIALVMLAGVNFVTGQFHDIPAITEMGHRQGCVVGWDLAHAAGNVPLKLHEWGPDFAAWCSYKYLNSGPGAIAGAFVHERWVKEMPLDQYTAMPRYEGWWGNDPDTRFVMSPEFVPNRTADAWALSNPPIFSMVPVKVSLAIFDRVGMDALRGKSLKLTAYLESLIDAVIADSPDCGMSLITPRQPERRGCQLSILIERPHPRSIMDRLHAGGVLCDFREPNVVRVAPTPSYNSFHDCWKFAQVLRGTVG